MKLFLTWKIPHVLIVQLFGSLLFTPLLLAQKPQGNAKSLEIAVYMIDPRRQANDPLDETTKIYSLYEWNNGKQDRPTTGLELMNKGYKFRNLVWSTGAFLSVYTKDPQDNSAPQYRDITVYLVDPYRQVYDPMDQTTKLYSVVDWNNGVRNRPVTGVQLAKKGHKFLQLLAMDGGFYMIYIQ